jgi:Family of unknown function (DUF6537)
VASILSSLRYLFADILGEDDAAPPFLPEGLPEGAIPVVSEGIDLLIDYQGASYAQLYVDRVTRFVGRPRIGVAMLCDIAQLLARRMAYEDPIRVAQLRLAELRNGAPRRSKADLGRFRLDELVGALPEAAADPLLTCFGWVGCLHRPVPMTFSAASPLSARCLKLVAALRRWRRFSVRYAEERAWVERWLHMIARCLDKQPASTAAIVASATMVQGYGEAYRQGLADWHAIIDGLAKPTFDGVLPLADLAAAVAQARAAAMPDPRQVALKRSIAQIRARALDASRRSTAAE